MTRAVFVLGALMALVGLLVISYGIPLVRMEIGWTAVIAGSVATSTGCVVLVLGVFLVRLEQMQASLDRLLPVATPDDLPSYSPPELEPLAPEPIEVPAPSMPLHPLSPAARAREPEDAVQPQHQVLVATPEPALELAVPLRSEPDWPGNSTRVAEPVLTESAPALVLAEEEASHPPLVEAPVADPVADSVEIARPRPSFLSSLLTRRGAAERSPGPSTDWAQRSRELSIPASEMPALRDLPVDLSSGWDEAGTNPLAQHALKPVQAEAEAETPSSFDAGSSHASHEDLFPHRPESDPASPVAAVAEPEPPLAHGAAEPVVDTAPPPPPDPLQPIVVGRYNAGSASYVMFSNGMIQVETEQGTHEFASMQDLKVFIEQRDARAS